MLVTAPLATVITTVALLLVSISARSVTGVSSDCREARDWAVPTPEVRQFTLNNGLRIVVSPNARSETLAVLLLVGVGARDEARGETGYAHLFEHMMFKGTATLPDGSYFEAIGAVGGRANASTDYDQTEFHSETPRGSLARVLYLEGDRLAHLLLTPAGIRNQVEAVLEEKRLRVDNVPYVPAVVRFMMQVWKNTPYNHSIIGSEADLRTATVASLGAFLRRFYHPGNLLLSVVGPVDSDHVRALTEQYLGALAPGVRPPRKPFQLQGGAVHASISDPMAPFPLYAFAWQAQPLTLPDRAATALLGDLLAGSDAARVPDALKNRLGMAHIVLGIPLQFQSVRLLGFGAVPHGFASLSDVSRVVEEEVARLRHELVPERELCRALKMRYRDLLVRYDRNLGLARSLAQGAMYHGDPLWDVRLLQALMATRPPAVRAAAQSYLAKSPLRLVVTPPWYLNLAKHVLEWLPRPVAEWIEGMAL